MGGDNHRSLVLLSAPTTAHTGDGQSKMTSRRKKASMGLHGSVKIDVLKLDLPTPVRTKATPGGSLTPLLIIFPGSTIKFGMELRIV